MPGSSVTAKLASKFYWEFAGEVPLVLRRVSYRRSR